MTGAGEGQDQTQSPAELFAATNNPEVVAEAPAAPEQSDSVINSFMGRNIRVRDWETRQQRMEEGREEVVEDKWEGGLP